LIVDITYFVNNYAENKVKLCQDFNGSAHKEKYFQCLLQVVENYCHTLPKKKEPGLEVVILVYNLLRKMII